MNTQKPIKSLTSTIVRELLERSSKTTTNSAFITRYNLVQKNERPISTTFLDRETTRYKPSIPLNQPEDSQIKYA